MNENYAGGESFEFNPIIPRPFRDLINSQYDVEFKKQAETLLNACLNYVPKSRTTAFQALTLPFFNQLREEDTRLPNGESLPDIFQFED